jgi:hypothetical protein
VRYAVYAPFVISAILGLLAPALARGLRPATAARLLVAAGAASALTTSFALGALTLTLIGQIPLVAAIGGWSGPALRSLSPVAAVTATVAGLVLAGVAVLLARTCAGLYGTLSRAGRACRRMGGEPGGTVVVEDPEPIAYAVPGGALGPGRVVVSSGMLRALTPADRRALFAHESAHLRHRHHLYRMTATAVASLDPLLRRLPDAVEYATERWADEDAAAQVGSRRAVARALASAALAGRTNHAGQAPGFVRHDVPRRVRALLAGPPGRRTLPVVALAGLLVASILAVQDAAEDADKLFDQAHRGGTQMYYLGSREAARQWTEPKRIDDRRVPHNIGGAPTASPGRHGQ